MVFAHRIYAALISGVIKAPKASHFVSYAHEPVFFIIALLEYVFLVIIMAAPIVLIIFFGGISNFFNKMTKNDLDRPRDTQHSRSGRSNPVARAGREERSDTQHPR